MRLKSLARPSGLDLRSRANVVVDSGTVQECVSPYNLSPPASQASAHLPREVYVHRLFTRIARTIGLLALAVAGATIASGSASAASDVVGHLYVNDNTAGANTIAAFDRHADGSLTPLPGSPFPAGGAGTGAGIGSQGALQLSSDGKYLLAVDAGSNQI